MKHPLSLCLAAAVLTLASQASAGDASEQTNHDGAHLHDGFYLRMALGAGGFASRDTVGDTASTKNQPTYVGSGGAFELSIGGTPRPGVVFAGTFIAQSALLGTLRDSAGTMTITHRHDFAMFGPTIDYFPMPSRGFHVLGTVGPVLMSDYVDDRIKKTWSTRGGAGLSLGIGYDAWISANWSLGFLLRATGASMKGSEVVIDDKGNATTVQPDTQRSIAAISLTFTGLYH